MHLTTWVSDLEGSSCGAWPRFGLSMGSWIDVLAGVGLVDGSYVFLDWC